MQGKRSGQLSLFTVGDIDELVPKDHLVRRLDRVVDTSFVREMTSHLYVEGKGRPSIDPELFFRMQLLRAVFKVPSDRQLCDEIRVNLAYRWFLGISLEDKVPDHSSMTRIRDRLGEETFKLIFERIVTACKKAGLVKGESLMMDSTLIEANAALRSLAEKNEAEPPKRKESPSYKKTMPGYADGTRKVRYSNATHQSKTDRDAELVARRKTFGKLFHKAHVTIDAPSRIITDCFVTGGAVQDCEVAPSRLEHQREALGLSPKTFTADRGYGTGKNYGYLASRSIRAYVPPLHKEASQTGKEHFVYDKEDDSYTCPAGERLNPYCTFEKKDLTGYRPDKGVCTTCPLKKDCTPGNDQRLLYRHRYEAEFTKIRRRFPTKAFRKQMSERAWRVEGTIGELKERLGFRRARYRGRSKVQIEAYMAAIAANFRRVAASRRLTPALCFSSKAYWQTVALTTDARHNRRHRRWYRSRQ